MERQRPLSRGNDNEENRGGRTGGSAKREDPFAPHSADPFARTNPSTAQVDPFADLLHLSFSRVPDQASGTASATRDVAAFASEGQPPVASGPSTAVAVAGEGVVWGMDPLTSGEGSLAAKKRKSQESRQKRDEFLNQMSSFLQGIENSKVDVIPPDPPMSFANPGNRANVASLASSAGQHVPRSRPESDSRVTCAETDNNLSFWPSVANITPPKSSLMQDGPADVFHGGSISASTPTGKGTDDLKGVLGGSSNPHPRGSLFDDDVGAEEVSSSPVTHTSGGQGRNGHLVASDPIVSSPQRVTPSPVPISTPFQDARPALNQARTKNKAKPSRGLDLEEVRRRTSLLSGEARTSSPPACVNPAPRAVASSGTPEVSLYENTGWRRQQPSQSDSFSGGADSHPLHAEPTDPLFSSATRGGTFDNRGNYFNEDLLLARAQGGGSSGFDPLGDAAGDGEKGDGQGSWGGDALMDTAGNFLSTARDGAKTLLRDAKAGVGAVSASWQKPHGDDQANFEQQYGSPWATKQETRVPRQQTAGSGDEYEVTFGDGRFGFTLFRGETGPMKGKGMVCRVHSNGTAQRLGVHLGDMVTGINKRRYDTYDDVMAVLPKLPRPVLISFQRGDAGWSAGTGAGVTDAFRAKSMSSQQPDQAVQQGGPKPLDWLAKLNPFDKNRRDGEEEDQGLRRNASGTHVAGTTPSFEPGMSGEAFAKGLGGGVFSWSYYGTSDGVEPNTRDTYTEHVMRCQWGRTVDTMQSWMVARRYREFDALDMDLRDAYPDRKDALPRLPPKELFKMAPDVVERRTKGLETYMTTIIRRFPDMLESSHMDRFLTISERISAMDSSPGVASSRQALPHQHMDTHGSSSNVFPASESVITTSSSNGTGSALVGTDYILNLMTSEDAYRLAQEKRPDPVEVVVAEDLIRELEDHLARLPPSAHLLSDAKLYQLVERCQQCWPQIKAAAAAAVSGESSNRGPGAGAIYTETFLPRMLQCDEGMERAFDNLRGALASRGYIGIPA